MTIGICFIFMNYTYRLVGIKDDLFIVDAYNYASKEYTDTYVVRATTILDNYKEISCP